MGKLLAVDVGATKVLVSAFDAETDTTLAEKRYLSADFNALSELIQTFQQEFSFTHFDVACLGLAGPVSARQVHLTNLPWIIDADALAQDCHIDYVEIMNDFAAAALGINELSEEDTLCLQAGDYDEAGNKLIVGAGSGLGISPIKNCGGEFIPQASEGGHMDFAPLDSTQLKLFDWLHKKWTHVSYERILSGEGIEFLYAFFNAENHGHSHHNLTPICSAEQVHELAIKGEPIAQKTLNTFVEVYGAYIGNVSLLWQAKAGVYIAGGIGPKIRDWMQQPRFIKSMTAKGRMSNLVKDIPVYLVINDQIGLLGMKHLAKQRFSQKNNK
ncbi:glucokinase [Hydrogenovibrio sp. JE_KL2]|uniref:glucokinase n=1 Tax=Hydrogenovibrio sp. JE_KL2 TaxID=2651188 RepID=UPI00128E6DB8|nr:glucokinase [Hydrogenovibrio sp. JE_KL2]MPQ76127.1 glucokinase [Hydrogenovibrio sp. JE_KL2]